MSKPLPLSHCSVAITGGSGFIGSHINKILTSLGATVFQFNGPLANQTQGEFDGDIGNREEVSRF
ncbi:MAG: hypothetical protein IPK04_06445 [Bdellovibrionales bacterium]|nr:hypothetical protein [Bdellovibrionales bacterium]